MSRYVKLALIFLSVSVSTAFQVNQAAAYADVECRRKTNSKAGFVSVRAFDAWFPKTIYFHRSSAERRQTEGSDSPAGTRRVTACAPSSHRA